MYMKTFAVTILVAGISAAPKELPKSTTFATSVSSVTVKSTWPTGCVPRYPICRHGYVGPCVPLNEVPQSCIDSISLSTYTTLQHDSSTHFAASTSNLPVPSPTATVSNIRSPSPSGLPNDPPGECRYFTGLCSKVITGLKFLCEQADGNTVVYKPWRNESAPAVFCHRFEDSSRDGELYNKTKCFEKVGTYPTKQWNFTSGRIDVFFGAVAEAAFEAANPVQIAGGSARSIDYPAKIIQTVNSAVLSVHDQPEEAKEIFEQVLITGHKTAEKVAAIAVAYEEAMKFKRYGKTFDAAMAHHAFRIVARHDVCENHAALWVKFVTLMESLGVEVENATMTAAAMGAVEDSKFDWQMLFN